MRNKFLFPTFSKSLFGILVLLLCVNCNDNILQNENLDNLEAIELKSTQTTDFIVITKSEAVSPDFEALISSFGKIVTSIPEIGIVVVSPSVADFEKKISEINGVHSVVPDLKIKMIPSFKINSSLNSENIGEDEPGFFLQWGLDAIDAPEAWAAGYTGKGARVFILDTGIDPEHPDLSSNLNQSLSKSFVPGEDYMSEDGEFNFHGNMVAGIIAAADNGLGIIGVAPEAEIVAVKVVSEFTGSAPLSQVNEGIVYAANNDADVINMSLGFYFNKNGFYYDENDILQKVPAVYIQNLILAHKRAVSYAVKKGVLVVAAAGNGGNNSDGNGSFITFPADLENVIAVSATAPDYWYNDLVNGITNTNFDIPSHFTTYGRSIVDLAAPGGDYDYLFMGEPENWWWDMILTCVPGGWDWGCGTSFSSPHVVGTAALIISKNGGKMDPQKVTQQLYKTADNIDGNGQSLYFGKGRVNAYRAVTE